MFGEMVQQYMFVINRQYSSVTKGKIYAIKVL